MSMTRLREMMKGDEMPQAVFLSFAKIFNSNFKKVELYHI